MVRHPRYVLSESEMVAYNIRTGRRYAYIARIPGVYDYVWCGTTPERGRTNRTRIDNVELVQPGKIVKLLAGTKPTLRTRYSPTARVRVSTAAVSREELSNFVLSYVPKVSFLSFDTFMDDLMKKIGGAE